MIKPVEPSEPVPAALAACGLTPDSLQRIAEAVEAAEAKTSAEIRVVVTSSPLIRHSFYSVLWASLIALLTPWVVAVLWPMRPLPLLAIQAAVFVLLSAILFLPFVAPYVVPRFAVRRAARAAAVEHFLSHGVPQTEGRTGILIFAAAPEHLIEVVADEGVHRTLGHEAWRDICAAVASEAARGHLEEGLVAGVTLAGARLSGPLPRGPDDVNELPDNVVIL